MADPFMNIPGYEPPKAEKAIEANANIDHSSLINIPGYDDFSSLFDASPEAQVERDKKRLSILESEYQAGGKADKALSGDIEKLKRTGGGYGSFPKLNGIKVEVDEDPINIEAIRTKDTTEKLPSKEDINKMSFLEVNKLREKYKGDDRAQELLGSREHYLFMEDIIRKNPEAAPGAVAATLGYHVLKTTEVGRELVKTTEEKASKASIEQLKGGLGGIVSGLALKGGDTMLEMLGVEIDRK